MPTIATTEQIAKLEAMGATGIDLDTATPEGTAEAHLAIYAMTDIGNAERFRDRNKDLIRYNHVRRQWLAWDRHRWVYDSGQAARRLAIETIQHAMSEAALLPDETQRTHLVRWFLVSQNINRLKAMVELARDLDPIAEKKDDNWDTNPNLLGCPNGVIEFDPATGQPVFRDGKPEDRITLNTSVEYHPEATCETWVKFRNEVHPDPEIRNWTALALGYSITGHTREQVSFWGHGVGSNGKSTEYDTVRNLLGDYGYVLPHSTFTGRADGGGVPNDLAALVGRRFVTGSEVPKGARTNEQRLKDITGGGKLNARFMRAEWFEFQPVAKVWHAVNHKPTTQDDSEGYWRRIRLIPYGQRFEKDTDPPRDDELLEKLATEAPGILAWLVRQAERWYAFGLANVPDAVSAATAGYRAENDPLGAFLTEMTVQDIGAKVGASDFYNAFLDWCDQTAVDERERPSQTSVGKTLRERFKRRSTNRGVVYDGIGLTSEDQQMALAPAEDEAA